MIDSAKNYRVAEILKTDDNVCYEIPKYQRKYTWSKVQWEPLFEDICFNDSGHFLGSIICINVTRDAASDHQLLELVDGQQRLTTLSLLYAAIYGWIEQNESELDEDQQDDFRDIKRRLTLRKTNKVRVSPSYHGSNFEDYRAVIGECGALEKVGKPANAGNRKMFKAYRYFLGRLTAVEKDQPLFDLPAVFDLLKKINNAIVVKIEVASHADAYILFESLNNRGVPLSALDLIKNKLLSELQKNEVGSLDENFEQWNAFLENLSDDYATQERFLRHFYNAFKHREEIAVEKAAIATRSKIIRIYQTLIEKDAEFIFKELRECARHYARLIEPEHDDNSADLKRALYQLERIGGAPCYTFLLFLLQKSVNTDDLVKVIELLVCFFVRRSVTSLPPTSDLDRFFMELVAMANKKFNIAEIANLIRSRSASDERFEESLNGDMYESNAGATRFILCALEEHQQTSETKTNLWQRDEKKKFIWTIEHVFPQGKNIPKPWVEMIAGGDEELANKHREEFVHQLGNLTITGFNTRLSNMAFDKKRDRVDKKNKAIGYKNDLALNKELAKRDDWTTGAIKARTSKLVKETLTLFNFARVQKESL